MRHKELKGKVVKKRFLPICAFELSSSQFSSRFLVQKP